MKCGGCREEIGNELRGSFGWFTFWESDFVDDDTDVLVKFCTPRCLHDFARRLVEKDPYEQLDPELLKIVAMDMFEAIEGKDFSKLSDDQAEAIWECWARLGHVLGQLDPRPVEIVEAERDRAVEAFGSFMRDPFEAMRRLLEEHDEGGG